MPHGVAKKGFRARCPACAAEIHFRKPPSRGNFVTCQECASLLEVVRLSPLTLEWISEEPLDSDHRHGRGFSEKSSRKRSAAKNDGGVEDE